MTRRPSRRLPIEALWEARDTARFKADDKRAAREERLAAKAQALIGQLVREGKTVYYVAPVGGRYKEGTQSELTDYLIRNHHVTR